MPDDAPRTAVNPVLPGCHPDPSTCRVRDDYYLVTSTFEYFPGLPIFHSRDLIHWRQLGHAIDRAEQLDLSGVPSSGGLLAATLRHHDGVFYLVNTLVHAGDGVAGGNYYSRPTIRGAPGRTRSGRTTPTGSTPRSSSTTTAALGTSVPVRAASRPGTDRRMCG